MSDVGHNSVAGDRLRLLIERIERLEEEKKGISDDIKDVYGEAKATGFDVKTMRAIVKLQSQHPEWSKMRIEGHADIRGDGQYNQNLSERRATTVRVTSSDIAGVQYDVESCTMTIEFHATGRYRYFSVPPELRDEFVESVCPGKFFLMQIKGRFAWEKVTP